MPVLEQANVQLKDKSSADADSQAQFSGTSRTNSMVVLGTAVVRIKDRSGLLHPVRVLLDSGSQISAITSNCVSRLGLPKHRCHTEIVGLAQKPVAKVNDVITCQLLPHYTEEHIFNCKNMMMLPIITDVMPSMQLPPSVRKNYQHLLLADPEFDIPSQIDILLGGDIFPSIVRPRADIIHRPGFSSALDTLLGWVVVGAITNSTSSPSVSLTTIVTPSVEDLLQQFWAVEEPTAPASPTTEEQCCEEYFMKSTTRDSSGRFCVALPFRDLFTGLNQSLVTPCHGLGDSRDLALRRFYNLERRLSKDSDLYAAYRHFMSMYQTLGHMVPAPEPGKYFIPHHAVFKADGDMTKIRVVFDASAISSSGCSLNDVLCTGPKLQTDLRDILLQCRMHRYILTADIIKMYRQILIKPEDRIYQHIFWRDKPGDVLQEFQLCTITYGLNCAPYLAIRCLKELDAQDGWRFPLAKCVLTQSTYVDDIIIGAETEEQLLLRKNDIIGLLRSGACELSKWTSNSAIVRESIRSDDQISSVSFDPREEHSVKVLGLHWDTKTDSFAYHTSIQQASSTKRQVLSIISRLFDPIGALGPLLLWAKCFMQTLWHNKLDWDDPMPHELLSMWQQFCSELPSIFSLNLPRHIDVTGHQDIQLLGFADASSKGYAATIFLRIVYTTGEISVKFLTCKTKVAPLKSSITGDALSIPRLELCGALLLAQTLQHTYRVLSSETAISRLRAFTDSSTVLSWLTSK